MRLRPRCLTPEAVRRRTEWANRIALAAHAAPPPGLFEGPLALQLVFFRTRPKSLSKRVIWPLTRPDTENMIKGLADALEGIVYRDDAQLVMLAAVKRFAAHGTGPGVRITVEALDSMSGRLPG